jgi:hypothetical protein
VVQQPTGRLGCPRKDCCRQSSSETTLPRLSPPALDRELSTRNLLNYAVTNYMEQLLRYKAESLVSSVFLDLMHFLRFQPDLRSLWKHFSRQYNPFLVLLNALGVLVEPAANAAPSTTVGSSLNGGMNRDSFRPYSFLGVAGSSGEWGAATGLVERSPYGRLGYGARNNDENHYGDLFLAEEQLEAPSAESARPASSPLVSPGRSAARLLPRQSASGGLLSASSPSVFDFSS